MNLLVYLRSSLVQWKRWHHKLNVETLWGLSLILLNVKIRTNVVQCCVKFSSHCLNNCEVLRWADHSPHQISNPFETNHSTMKDSSASPFFCIFQPPKCFNRAEEIHLTKSEVRIPMKVIKQTAIKIFFFNICDSRIKSVKNFIAIKFD